MVITNAQLHSTKPELRFCTGSNPACGVSEIRNGKNLWQWSQLEMRLNTFRRSTIPPKQFIMQLNYSHLKILKLKIHSLFLVTLFCVHITWWQHFTTLAIHVFSLPFFLNAKSPILPLVSLKSPLNWPKVQNGLLLKSNQIVKRGTLLQS